MTLMDKILTHEWSATLMTTAFYAILPLLESMQVKHSRKFTEKCMKLSLSITIRSIKPQEHQNGMKTPRRRKGLLAFILANTRVTS